MENTRHQDIVDSTAATRLNGYVGCSGTPEQLSREIDTLGLSPAGRRKIERLVQGKGLLNLRSDSPANQRPPSTRHL